MAEQNNGLKKDFRLKLVVGEDANKYEMTGLNILFEYKVSFFDGRQKNGLEEGVIVFQNEVQPSEIDVETLLKGLVDGYKNIDKKLYHAEIYEPPIKKDGVVEKLIQKENIALHKKKHTRNTVDMEKLFLMRTVVQ